MKNIFIHEKAIVDTKKIGEGTRIWGFVHVLPNATIGENANICEHVFIENDVVIGDNVTIKCGVWVWDGITIGDNVQIGPSVVFTNDKFPRAKNKDFKLQHINVKQGASIGAGSILLPGVTIGKFAMVGAGSLVTKDVPDYGLVYGSPARLISYICTCNEKFSLEVGNSFKCLCGKEYMNNNGLITLI